MKQQVIPKLTSLPKVSELEKNTNKTDIKSLQKIVSEPNIEENKTLWLQPEREYPTGIGDTCSNKLLLTDNIDQCSNLVQKHSNCDNRYAVTMPLDKELLSSKHVVLV